MTNVISLEKAVTAIGRAFALILLIILALCSVKALLAGALDVLKNAAFWLAIGTAIVIGFVSVLAIIPKFRKRVGDSSSEEEKL